MKTYKAILLAIIGLVIVVGGSYYSLKVKTQRSAAKKDIKVAQNVSLMKGQVVRMHEGKNTLSYQVSIPESATTTYAMDDALITVTNNNAPYMAMYMSYEGGRGYSAEDYITNNIVPHVKALTITGTTTIGSFVWMKAESEFSEWHIAIATNGQWLIVVESPKSEHDQVVKSLESLTTE